MNKRINSRQKGKRGEREAAKFLQSLGIVARRGQQFSGGKDSPDVVTELENVHIEVKFGVKGMDLGTNLLAMAAAQSQAESGGKKWVVLWKPRRACWRLTFDFHGYAATVFGVAGIRYALDMLEGRVPCP